ncbi:hypothetical protein GGF42_000569 [Coemansia sp. RSA 2424]|nr:hypothetical protein GGF42_000569 [Coemansia sp. RSA 2424]
MSTVIFRRVALLGGSGPLPASFIEAFKQTGDEFDVTVLTRKESLEATKQAINGFPQFSVRAIDYEEEDESDLVAALQGQQVVISLLAPSPIATQVQTTVFRAALKAGGVKWFLPSEFGLDLDVPAIRQSIMFAGKLAMRHDIEASDMAYTYIVTGAFAELFVIPFHDWDTANRTIVVPDSGNKGQTKISFSTRRDIAQYTVAVLRRFDQFKNKTVRVASFTASYIDWIEAIKSVKGVEFTPTFNPVAVLENRLAEANAKIPVIVDSGYVADQLHLAMAKGYGQLDVNGKRLDSEDLLEVTPTPLESVVRDIQL